MASIRSLEAPPCLVTQTQQGHRINSMTKHASAHETFVLGITSNPNSNSNSNSVNNDDINNTCNRSLHEQEWINWKTDLHYQVSEVTSNHDGSIIAASTVDGSVSILNGSNGDVLLTKSISSNTEDGEEFAHSISFVQNNNRYNQKDILVVYQLNRNIGRNRNKNRNSITSESSSSSAMSMDMILVSNIDGYNHDLSKMEVGGVKLKLQSQSHMHNTAALVKGCFVNNDTIRFVVSDLNDLLSVHDYDIGSKQSSLVKDKLEINGNSQEWNFEAQAGICLDLYHASKPLMVLAASASTSVSAVASCSPIVEAVSADGKQESESKIESKSQPQHRVKLSWYDLDTLECLSEYHFPFEEETTTTNTTAENVEMELEVLAVTALKPCLDGSVSVAVACNSLVMGGKHKVVILQGDLNIMCEGTSTCTSTSTLISTDDNDDFMSDGHRSFQHSKVSVNSVHEVYNIPVEGTWLTSINVMDSDSSFSNGESTRTCAYGFRYKVQTDSSMEYKEFTTGVKNTIAHARLLLARNNIDEADALLNASPKEELCTPYGSVHASEAVLLRFKNMLRNKRILTGESKDRVKECLHRLSFGAVSGGANGVKSLVEASRALHCWSSEAGPYIRDYRMALSAMAMSITNALQGVSTKYIDELRSEKNILESKANVFKTIEIVLDSVKPKVRLSAPLLQVTTHVELYQLLISFGAFKVAENVRQSENGAKFITPEVVAKSVTKISSKMDPNAYCAWLQNVVFPGLTINHKVLESIFAWACEISDLFDQDGSHGIDASISLLNTVKIAVAKLSFDSHGSFASHSPFSETIDSPSMFPSHIDLNRSIDSHNSSGSRSRDNSLLNSALKANQTDAMNIDQTVPLDEPCSFKTKLRHAQIIKAARQLGMSDEALRLTTFGKDGPALAAKELVRLFFANAWSDYLADHTKDKEKLHQFCQFANTSFDCAVEKYSKELCSKGSVDAIILSRANDLVAACSSPDVKCKITLMFLRTAQVSSSKPSCLKGLAKEAIQWATNEELKSELEEAKRLLGIDEILRRYCGNRAPEVFRVSDPVHSSRLVEYVSRKVNAPSVLSDIMYLCSAFTHLSPVDYCAALVVRMITADSTTKASLDSHTDKYQTVLQRLDKTDSKLSESVAVRVVIFCTDGMRNLDGKASERTLHEHEAFCSAAISVCRTAAKLSPKAPVLQSQKCLLPTTSTNDNIWAELLREFKRIQNLNKEFGLSISLTKLRSCRLHDSLLNGMLEKAVACSKCGEEFSDKTLRLKLTKARRGCSLLFGSDDSHVITSKWCKAVGHVSCSLVKSGEVESSMILLEASGLLDEVHSPSSYEAIVSVSVALCSKAADMTSLDEKAMKSVILANSLVHEHALVFCPEALLPFMMFLSNLVDVAGQMIVKSDCGVGEMMETYKRELLEKSRGRRKPLTRFTANTSDENSNSMKGIISLHSSWHTSDGLLLPPIEALSECMTYCKGLLSILSAKSSSDLLSVHEFLDSRGAHSISLRMLACASVVTTSNCFVPIDDSIFRQQAGLLQKIYFNLAERSLGGSGTGNTNARIDYELAVPSLLNLHVKVGFKAYKRCLPSAMSRRDFERVIALAHVGSRAAGVTSGCEDQKLLDVRGWRDQNKFVVQCQHLTSKAFWWRILQKYGVPFDFSAFDRNEKTKDSNDPKAYIASLVFELIRCASKVINKSSTVQLLAKDFCKSFQLDPILPLKRHVEFLLSRPSEGEKALDIRNDLIACTGAANDLLKLFSNKVTRLSIIRKCLVGLENIDESGKDFERYSMILSIYNSELRSMALLQSKADVNQLMCLQKEIERIDRRQDALAILSSFFSAKKFEDRPCFQKCFQPLPVVLDAEKESKTVKIIGVLGPRGTYDESSFDPIKPLQKCLQSEPNPSTTSALSSICIALGVPGGYIHARVLMERIIAAKSLGGSLPPFNTEVAPVIKKLKIANDGAELSEWCASQYDVLSEERLLSLKAALTLAIKASTQAEQALLTYPKKGRKNLIEKEKSALERVHRLKCAKSALSDIITVKNIIQKSIEEVEDANISTLALGILEKARVNKEINVELSPEQFAENLYVEGSLLAAEASLDVNRSLDMVGLCQIASIIHEACTALENQYSHINLGYISRALVRRWLLHGDEGKGPSVEQPLLDTTRMANDESMDCTMDEGDTVDFVLDLNMATRKTAYTDDVGCDEPKLKRLKVMTADEEQSSLKPTTSRELSEFLSSRVGLRVAFIMSFAQEFHHSDEFNKGDDENIDPNLLNVEKKIPVKEDLAKEHARYLLGLVFSKSGFEKSKVDSSCIEASQRIRSSLGNSSVNTKRVSRQESKAFTFAMRHRALRAAAALCPEETITSVIGQEEFFRHEKCSLSKCCFGSFLAKEIEAMGLPLPHSDLIQLSLMHQPSYARTLWRQRSSSTSEGFKGRLMLLILELALREGRIVDSQLVTSILTEVRNMNLPRTNLLVCECVSHLNNIEDLFNSPNESIGQLVLHIIKNLAASVLHDISVQDIFDNENNCVLTLQRLGKIITLFMSDQNHLKELDFLIDAMVKVGKHCNNPVITITMFEVAATIIREVKGDFQSMMLQKICSSTVDSSFLNRIENIMGFSKSIIHTSSPVSTKDCFEYILKIEQSSNANISKVLHS